MRSIRLFLFFNAFLFTAFAQPVANFTTSPTTICVGGSVQFTNMSTGAVSYNWTFPDGGPSQTSTLSDPLITYPNAGTFPVILTAVASDLTNDTEVKTGYVTVIDSATATLTSAVGTDNQTICVGDALDSIKYTLLGAQGATFTGLPSGVVGSVVADSTGGKVVITGNVGTPGTYNYSFTTTLNSCAPITVNGTITVDTPPTITLTAGSSTQLVCVNTAITDIEYTIGGTATSATVTGLPPGVTFNFNAGIVTISGVPTITGSFPFEVTTSGSACPPAILNGIINVDPDIQLISGPGTDNQTVCQGQPIIDIVYSLGAGITGATIDTLPAGITGVYSSGTYTISGSSMTLDTLVYNITTTGGFCGPAFATGQITIVEGPTISWIPTSGNAYQSVCVGSNIIDIQYNIGGSATGAFASGLPAGISGVFNAGVFTISGSTTQIDTFAFSVTTTGSLCGDISSFGQILVDTFPVIDLVTPITDSQQVCINTEIDTILYLLSGTAIGAYGINLPTGITVHIQSDSAIVSGFASSAGIYDFQIVTLGGACDADTAYGQLIVDDSSGVQLISAIGSDNQVMCNDGSSIDTIQYVLSVGADTAVVTNLPVGVTATMSNDTITITGAPTSTGTYVYDIVVTGGFCPDDTMHGTIEVQTAYMVLVSEPYTNDQLICINASLDSILYAVGGPVTVADLPPGVVSTYIPGTPNIFALTGTPTVAGSYHYTMQFSGPCGTSLAIGYITVAEGISNFVAGPDTTINLGQSVDLFAVGDNLLTYAWEPVETISNPIIFNPIATPSETTTYTVTATDDHGCTSSLPVTVTVVTDIELFVPNLFSPNGDGFNDLFEIPNLSLFPNTSVTVINREGQTVYENAAYDNSWDGTFEGKKLPDATYYYLVQFSTTDQVLKGAVTILRNEK